MALIYLILIVCAFPNVMCNAVLKNDELPIKIYGACLIGIIMFCMLIGMLYLLFAVFRLKNQRSVIGINRVKSTYRRQESNQVHSLGNAPSTPIINEPISRNEDNGSTLTVNSGMIEISQSSEPPTPTYAEGNRFTMIKKPKTPIMPPMAKAQMDKLIQQVLERKQKDPSRERPSVSLQDLDAIVNEEAGECLYENTPSLKKKLEPNVNGSPKPKASKDEVDGTKKKDTKVVIEDDDEEQEFYDTLPKPVRCSSVDALEDIPVYDLPPSKSENTLVDVEDNSHYISPLSNRESIENDPDNASYINAKSVRSRNRDTFTEL